MGAPSKERYRRQIAFLPLGEEGQERLARATVLVVGCGGTGAAAASALARAGVGRLRLLDDDRVALDNLHRQVLYDEADLGRLKVEVAARRLRAISATLTVEPQVARLTPRNVDPLLAGVSLVIDGTDNLASRYAINDGCLRHGSPWVYGGVEGAGGMVMAIRPGHGPCFACLFPPGDHERPLDEDGEGDPVLGPVPAAVAAIQAVEACRLLAGAEIEEGQPEAGPLLRFDLWQQRWQRIEVARDPACSSCGDAAIGS